MDETKTNGYIFKKMKAKTREEAEALKAPLKGNSRQTGVFICSDIKEDTQTGEYYFIVKRRPTAYDRAEEIAKALEKAKNGLRALVQIESLSTETRRQITAFNECLTQCQHQAEDIKNGVKQ